MQLERSVPRLNEKTLSDVLKYLPYQDIMEAYLVNREFGRLRIKEEFQQSLLQFQFGLPIHKQGDFREYYLTLKRLLAKVAQMYSLSHNLQSLKNPQLQMLLYRQVKKQQKLYQKVEVDARFVLMKALVSINNKRYVFGGISYYNVREFYMTIQDDDFQIPGMKLYPQILQGDLLVTADVDNVLKLGSRQRYSLFEINDKKQVFIKHNEDYLRKTTFRVGEGFYDYFNTLNAPKSDQTTLGIRIRTDARLVPSDPRFLVKEPFFSYQIRFSDNGASEKGAKLISRLWRIRSYDSEGSSHEQTVEGPGVIGYYPHIFKGCEDFLYESCAGVKGVRGEMEGHFNFQNLQTKERFNVVVKTFQLQYGPDVAYEYDSQNGSVTRIV